MASTELYTDAISHAQAITSSQSQRSACGELKPEVSLSHKNPLTTEPTSFPSVNKSKTAATGEIMRHLPRKNKECRGRHLMDGTPRAHLFLIYAWHGVDLNSLIFVFSSWAAIFNLIVVPSKLLKTSGYPNWTRGVGRAAHKPLENLVWLVSGSGVCGGLSCKGREIAKLQ